MGERPNSFAANTLTAWGSQIRAGDLVHGPYQDFAEAPVHELDIAEVAQYALLTDNLTGRRLELTGPQSLTHAELVATVGEVLGRELRYQEVPPDTAAARMVQLGLPEPFVTALMARYAAGAGRPAPVTDTVAAVLDRPARSYAAWVEDHAADFKE